MAWLDSELVDEQAPRLPVDVERLDLSTGAVEREHELCAKRLAIRMQSGERLEFADEVPPAAEGEVCVDPPLEGDEAKLFQPADLSLGERFPLQIREGRPAPEGEGVAED